MRVSGAAEASRGELLVDGSPLALSSPLLLALHKPAGIVCDRVRPDSGEEAKSVWAQLPAAVAARVQLCGRLDRRASGLLLLTESGKLSDWLRSGHRHRKRYAVRLADALRGDEAEAFAAGTLRLRGDAHPCLPARLEGAAGARDVLVELREGRYHQLRRMFGALGHRVTGIHRVAFGGVELGSLPVRQWRLLTERELHTLLHPPPIAADWASAPAPRFSADDPAADWPDWLTRSIE